MTKPLIWLIEDDPIIGRSLQQRLELDGLASYWSPTLAHARRVVDNPPSGLCAVVSDVRLPDGLASEWFVELPAHIRRLPWFFLTAYEALEDAIAVVRAGAREYLTKPFDIEQLIGLIRQTTHVATNPVNDAFLGVSAVMRQVESMVRRTAPLRASVLLYGETGVGKEVTARLLHDLDTRSDKGDFVAVNCAAIPETLLEAEFFGYEKGAFTGAQKMHRGYLEQAHRGTLFLDEVGDLPLAMQAKLLRALQERSFHRLGSERLTHSDFRIIAATNRDLRADVMSGRFREDLYYRLAVVQIRIPPLRERPEDVRWLCERIAGELALDYARPIAISQRYIEDLMRRPWPGNVRELRAHLERAIIFSDGGILDLPDKPEPHGETTEQLHDPKPVIADRGMTAPHLLPLHLAVQEAQRAHILRALRYSGGSISAAAESLGISRKTLWEKMRRLGIDASSSHEHRIPDGI
jgi:DNA-binding NtrC family response regulator